MEEQMGFEELQKIVSVCLDEIVKLKHDKEKLVSAIKEVSDAQKVILEWAETFDAKTQMVIERSVNNMQYEWNDPRHNNEKMYYPMFYGIEETLRLIIEEGKSMARFGDGEFAIMGHEERQEFQRFDEKLAERLSEVIHSDEDGLLIALADNYGSLDQYNPEDAMEIRCYMTDEVREQHRQFLDLGRRYHNAYITRPYVIYADNGTDAPKKRFEQLKRIWDKRNIIFVEGSQTRLGVGNDLFDNAMTIRRIETPPTNSFDKYDEILEAALKSAEPDSLFLIAMGPSAGVLAYDLYRAGYQALDIGHVDLEYEWFLKGTGMRCEVKHKYNNEWSSGNIVEDIQDEEYLKQIICIVEA